MFEGHLPRADNPWPSYWHLGLSIPLEFMKPLILNFGLHGLTFQNQILTTKHKACAGDSSYYLLVLHIDEQIKTQTSLGKIHFYVSHYFAVHSMPFESPESYSSCLVSAYYGALFPCSLSGFTLTQWLILLAAPAPLGRKLLVVCLYGSRTLINLFIKVTNILFWIYSSVFFTTYSLVFNGIIVQGIFIK